MAHLNTSKPSLHVGIHETRSSEIKETTTSMRQDFCFKQNQKTMLTKTFSPWGNITENPLILMAVCNVSEARLEKENVSSLSFPSSYFILCCIIATLCMSDCNLCETCSELCESLLDHTHTYTQYRHQGEEGHPGAVGCINTVCLSHCHLIFP